MALHSLDVMQPGLVTLEDARAIAASVLCEGWAGPGTFMVAAWGHGDDDAWNVIAGAREAIEDGDPEFVMLDDLVHLVDRRTGKLTEHFYFDLWDQLGLMRTVGEAPPDCTARQRSWAAGAVAQRDERGSRERR